MPVDSENVSVYVRLVLFGILIGALAVGLAFAMVILRLARWWKREPLAQTLLEKRRRAWATGYRCRYCKAGRHDLCEKLACECVECRKANNSTDTDPVQGGRIWW